MGLFSKSKTKSEIEVIARDFLRDNRYPSPSDLNVMAGPGKQWEVRAYFDADRRYVPKRLEFGLDGAFIDITDLGEMN